MTWLPRYAPDSLTTASLQPVRMPGSTPSTDFGSVRRGEEQLAQVLGEDVDRRGVGDLAQAPCCTSFSMLGWTYARSARRAARFITSAAGDAGRGQAARSKAARSSASNVSSPGAPPIDRTSSSSMNPRRIAR